MFRHRSEGERNAKPLRIDFEIGILMLEYDRQLMWPLLGETTRYFDARRMGEKTDRKMMFARKMAIFGDIAQDLAHDTAHRVLHKEIVTNNICRH